MERKTKSPRPPPTVALFNASDDTVEMVERMLATTGISCTACHFADLKKGNVDFSNYLAIHNPAVVIFDISPPYSENWEFFKTMRDSKAMKRRSFVLTTTNKERLDEIIGNDSTAIEIVGKPYDLQQITTAIEAALRKTEGSSRLTLVPRSHDEIT